MKSLSVIALIISTVAFSISISVGYLHLYNVRQISEIRVQQKAASEDILKIQQQLAKSWDKDSKDEHGYHGHGNEKAENEEQWPKFHDAVGVIKIITQERVIVDQQEMPGFMRAMIMSYKVENPEQLKNLKENQKVKLKLKETATELTVTEISSSN